MCSRDSTDTGKRICDYVARKSEPERWHGDDEDKWLLDCDPDSGGLGIDEWWCPHPVRKTEGGSEDYCVFHAKELPEGVDWGKAILEALDHAGESPYPNRPEHRGQFVGARIGAVDFSGEAIAADGHDVRFDHTVFDGKGDNIIFEGTKFVTQGSDPISCICTTFRTEGNGDVIFQNATFKTEGEGDVRFPDTRFVTEDHGEVWFQNATFKTEAEGNVRFRGAMFMTEGDGKLRFTMATFKAEGDGYVWFPDTRFKTQGDSDVKFRGASFTTEDNGDVWFQDARFKTEGDGAVRFAGATFKTEGDGHVWFQDASFETGGDGQVRFPDAVFQMGGEGHVLFNGVTLTDGDLSGADFDTANFGGANLRGISIDYTELTNIQIDEGTTFGGRSQWEVRADGKARDAIPLLPSSQKEAILDPIVSRAIQLKYKITPTLSEGFGSLRGMIPDFLVREGTRLKGSHPVFLSKSYNALRNPLRSLGRWRTNPDPLGKAARQYRATQRALRENDLRELRELEVRENHALRKKALTETRWRAWLIWAFKRWPLGYGEQPLKVVLTSILVIGAGTLLYPIWGLQNSGTGPELITYAGGQNASQMLPVTLGKSIYFSTVTFTTVGYGDLQPLSWAQTIATIESFVGALLMAYLVFVLGRRVTW